MASEAIRDRTCERGAKPREAEDRVLLSHDFSRLPQWLPCSQARPMQVLLLTEALEIVMIIRVKLCFLFAAGIEPKGCRLTLKITDPEDLNRDVLKVQVYSLKKFCSGWLVLVFSRGKSIALVHPTPLCTRKIQKTTQKTTFCKACEIFRHFPQIFQNN